MRSMVNSLSSVREKNDLRRSVLMSGLLGLEVGTDRFPDSCEVCLPIRLAPEVELLSAGGRVVLQEDVAGTGRDVRPSLVALDDLSAFDLEHRVAQGRVVTVVE